MNPMMPQQPMMMPMQMPMPQMPQPQAPQAMPMNPMMATGTPLPMVCRMTCEMTQEGVVMKLAPMDASQLEAMRERMYGMAAMMAAGLPVFTSCGGVPVFLATTTK
jgi:hypothetical protein